MRKKNLETGNEIIRNKLPYEVEILSFGAVSVAAAVFPGITLLLACMAQSLSGISVTWPHWLSSILTPILTGMALHVTAAGMALAILSLYYCAVSLRKYRENPDANVWMNYRHVIAGRRFAVIGGILSAGFLAGLTVWVITEKTGIGGLF